MSHLLDGARYGNLFLMTVSDNHSLIDFLLVFFKVNLNFGLVADRNFLGDVTHERYLKSGVSWYSCKGNYTVGIGRTANLLTNHNDIRARYGTLVVGDCNGDCTALQIVVGVGGVNAARRHQ